MLGRRHAAAVLVVAVLAGASRLLAAAPASPPIGELVDMTAEQLEVDVAARTATLTGAVRVTKGKVSVACARVDVRYDEVPRVTWLRGSGGVVATIDGVRAEAPDAELDVVAHVLELRGGVRVARGGGWLSAERATIHVDTGKVSMSAVRGALPLGAADAGAPLDDPAPPDAGR